MKIQKKAQQGFTLIELMIVIAIVGILAAIALPAYQDYIIRSKMTEGLGALAEAKTTIAEYVASNGRYPADKAGGDNTAFGLNTIAPRPGTGEILHSIEVTDPTATETVYVTANIYDGVWDGSGSVRDESALSSFSLSGSTNEDGTMTWECIPGGGTNSAMKPKYLPANCRG